LFLKWVHVENQGLIFSNAPTFYDYAGEKGYSLLV
jgi:hypothetical protein